MQTALRESESYGIDSDNVTVIVIDVADVGERKNAMRRLQKLRVIQAASALLTALSLGGIAYCIMQLIAR